MDLTAPFLPAYRRSACLLLVSALVACGGGDDAVPPAHTQARSEVAAAAAVLDAPTPDLTPLALDGGKATLERADLELAEPRQESVASGSAVSNDDVRLAGLVQTPLIPTVALPLPHAIEAKVQAAASQVVDIHVSPSGNDAWTGALASANTSGNDGPVRTLATAQARARARIAAMVQRGSRLPLRVRIQPGTYRLSVPLSFSPQDSGAPGAPVSYEAVVPGTVEISGGQPLTPGGTSGSALVFAPPASSGLGWERGGQLFVNGQRAVLARTPNVGQYWFVQKAMPLPSEAAGAQGRSAFGASSEALNIVATLSQADRSRAIVNVMHSWTNSQHRLVDSAPVGGIRVAPAALWTFLVSGTSQRYWLENVPSALDAPGEFIWDASGVRYIPPTGISQAGATSALMPVLDRLIVVSGDVTQRKWIDHLEFRGLTLAHTASQMPVEGYLDWQAAIAVGAAMEVDGATNLVVDNCRFVGTGGYGVWFRRAVRNSSVTNSKFDDLGAGGIRFGMVNPPTSDAMQSGANVASNNVVGNTGKLYPGAVGIWVGRSFDNTVSNNLVFNTTYSGISIGWSWGLGEATAGRNTVADNLLVNIGQGQLADLGGIYTVGVSPGTLITGNVIREVRSYPSYGSGAWGLYGDAGTSQVTFVDNVVVGADHGGLQVSISRSNEVLRNLFAWGETVELSVLQPDAQTALNYQGNVLIPKVDKLFAPGAKAPHVTFGGNEVSRTFLGQAPDLSSCGTGCVATASALVVTPEPRGVSLASSNTDMVNRVARVTAKAGPKWLANPGEVVSVAAVKPSVVVAPPITFEPDIAGASLGTQPLGFWYSAPGNTAVIGIVPNASSLGGRCLQYTDASSNANSYDPHTYAPLNHASGTTVGEFDLLVDGSTHFEHQWRDNGSPKKTGPALEVKPTGVFVSGSLVAPVTVGKWMKFKITAPLANTGSTWTLQVTDGNGSVTTRSGLSFLSRDWGRLNWWGFVSQAKVATNFCLASVKANNFP